MHRKTLYGLVVLGVFGLGQASPNVSQVGQGPYVWGPVMEGLAPELIQDAYSYGLLDKEDLIPHIYPNPYYVRGDFNGDGENDIAFYVLRSERRTGRWGLVIVHSTLDTVFVFGAGARNPRGSNYTGEYMRVLRKGTVIRPLLQDPIRHGEPIELKTEALSVHFFAKSSGVYFWENGSYRFINRTD